ncbi:MAG: protein kinase [Myxococcota bacterium]|nr:protein kinase [Myxococcota bacterium]
MHSGVPSPGDIVAGKYRIERQLGAGGMGIVVAASHVVLQERVAMKFLSPELAVNDEAVARFVREARAACRIKSEHIARVSDVGTLESGIPYLVMEYLEGQDLAELLAQKSSLPPAEAVGFVLQACEAIAEAHVLGIVHRDLKPANLFLTHRIDGTSCIKVLDFGVSKLVYSATSKLSAGLTGSSAVMGSPLYMSPEQLRAARSVDPRADVWALGVILYELIAGKPPFWGETLPEVSIKIAVDPPEPMGVKRRDVTPALEAVVFRCLQKDREKRFRDISELARALAPHGPDGASHSAERIRRIHHSGRRIHSEALESRSSSVSGVASPLSSTLSWRRHGVWGVIGAVTLGALLSGLRSHEPSTYAASSPASLAQVEAESSTTLRTPPSDLAEEPIEPTIEPIDLEHLPLAAASAVIGTSGNPSPSRSAGRGIVPEARPAVAPSSSPGARDSTSPVVELVSNPDALVLVDGHPVGSTPAKIALPPGNHSAKFVRDGATVSRQFTVLPGKSSIVQVSSSDFEIANPYRDGAMSVPVAAGQSASSRAPDAARAVDYRAAAEEVRRLSANVDACSGRAGPRNGNVRLTFATSGRVQSSEVGGDFAETETGKCVAALFRTAKIPEFTGPPVTFTKQIRVP